LTGRPPGDEAVDNGPPARRRGPAGAIKPESKRGLLGYAAAGALSTDHQLGDDAADALSAGIKHESKRGQLGHAAASALSTGRPPGDEAAGALSEGAVKPESKRGLLV